MGRYFNSVWSLFSEEEMSEMQHLVENIIRDITVSQEGVQSKLEILNVDKSCGWDGLQPYIFGKKLKR